MLPPRNELERILETIAEGIYIVNAEGIIIYANESAEEMLGVKRSVLMGLPYSNPGYKVTTLEGKPYPIEERPVAQALKTGKLVRNVEYAVVRPDGRRVIISANAAPLRDETGAATGVVLSFADITTRKQAEEELKESERRFREMLEHVELIALILDTQGNIIFANDFLLNLTGWKREEAIGKSWFDIFIPLENREEIEHVFHDVITKGAPAHYENDIETQEGERHTIAFSNVLLRDRQGNVIGTASIGHDITTERQAAQEIRESRRQVLDILESITDGFFALDNDWRFTYINHKAAQLIGRRREELLFRNMWEALPELEGTIFDKEYHRAKEKMVLSTFEAFYPPLNKWFEVHVYPFEKGLSAYVSDITDQKKAAEALRESENRYRTLFEDSPVALWEQDASEITISINRLKKQGVKDFRAYFEEHPEITAEMLATIKIIDVNKAVLGLYGASSKEEFIKNFPATFTKEGLEAAKEFLISYAEREEVKFEAEFTSRTFKGDIKYVHVISFIPPGYEETRSKIFIATIDITERKKAEEALRSSQSLLQSIVDNTTAVIYVKDREGRYILINRQYEVLAHIKREEIVGKTDYDLYPEERANSLRANDLKVLDTGEPLEFEEVVPLNGELHTFISIKFPLRDPEGFVYAVCGISTDITDRKQAEEKLEREKSLSDALNNINMSIASTLDFNEIIQKVVIESTKAIGSEAAMVLLREADHWVIRYQYGLPQLLAGMRLTDEEAKAGALAARIRGSVVVNDTFHDERVNLAMMKKYNIRSLLVAPLIVRGDVVGTIYFTYQSAPIGFTEVQVDFASKLAAAISIALGNLRLYEAQASIADTLQEALLAVPEKVNHLEYGVLYRSATEAAQVGGDFYDLFELEHDRVGFSVGDVAGKGLEAASLTAVVKNIIRAYALEGYNPAEVMARTNNAIRALPGPWSFVTVIFAVFDKDTRRLVYCNAGHPPAIIKRKSQTVELLEVYSPIIGAFAGLRYENGETVLGVGDNMILYTDGIIEARRDREFFKEERLVEFVRELKPILAKELPKAIFDEVLRFSGGRLSDDVALLALAYTGK